MSYERDTRLEQGRTSAAEGETDYGGRVADACACVGGSDATVEGGGEGGQSKAGRQSQRLIEWATRRGLLVPDSAFDAPKKLPEVTAEHEVFYRADDGRIVKRTYAGTCGMSEGEPGSGETTPLFYFNRIVLMNREFGTDVRLEGVWMGDGVLTGWRGHGKQPAIVTSQAWIRGADLDNPNPTSREVQDYLSSFGFEPWGLRRNAWMREDGMYILDAHNQNFIKSAAGIVPVDLVIGSQSSGISY